jgi:predicted lipoprotein with Yx(FWY)xxD motif
MMTGNRCAAVSKEHQVSCKCGTVFPEEFLMSRTRVAGFAAVVSAGLIAVTACSSGDGTSGAPPAGVDVQSASLAAFTVGTAKANGALGTTGDNAAAGDPAAADWVELDAGSAGQLNPVVLNGKGFLLYRFDKDSAKPPTSNCDGDCARTWPPVILKPGGKVFLNGVDRTDVGLLKRQDGSMQVTIGGWALYRYSKDTQPGQANGQGVGGTWFGVTPEGGKTAAPPSGTDQASGVDYKTGTAEENGADLTAGDNYRGPRTDDAAMKWVQLTRGAAGGLNPIVHDGADMTLYRFDKDSAKPPTSNCAGDCAKTWPPVLVRPGSRIFVNGVTTGKIGIITRADGRRQVTIGGWPVYRFSGDSRPGDAKGEGVGGTWFAISPTGGKVTPAEAPPAGTKPASPSAPAQLGNGSAVLDSGKDFAEPSGSIGVAGPGCVAVANPALASSIVLTGGPVKLWKGANCTGQSTVITQSVADLSAIGFDKQVASIRFGDN